MKDDDVCSRLDRLIRLLAVAVSEGKTNRQQIELLSRAGFQPSEIALLIGTTPNTVRVEMSNLRKRKRPLPKDAEGE